MLINGDIKGLEIVAAADLSRDKILMQEIFDKFDTHADNQKVFNLPDRLIAKRFVFKLLYGATAYGYYSDADFIDVGYSQKQWQGVIDKFYEKYKGIRWWHDSLVDTVRRTGYIEIPSGRIFNFRPKEGRYGLEWPLTIIKNYPVQGFGADIVMLIRIELMRLLREAGLDKVVLLVMTVHDSLVLDIPKELCYNICMLMKQAVESAPRLIKENWGYDFPLPITCEIKVGPNKKDLENYEFPSDLQ